MAKYEILYIIRPNIEEATQLLKSLTVFQKSTLTFFVT